MDVTALSRRLAAHLRAGALAGGGSLLALAVAFVVVELRGASPVWGGAWIGASLLSVGLAARFGHRASAAGAAALAGRVLSALLLGAALIAIVVIPIASKDLGRIEAAGCFAAAGAALALVAAFAGRRRAVIEAPPIAPEITGALPAAPCEEPAEAYVIVPSGPPLTAAESERSSVAIEVRLSWGADLLRVDHLDPPRAYFAGEITRDLALSHEMLGVDHAALVRCDAGVAPRVVVPSGAKAVVEHVGDDARGPRREDAAAGAMIALELGTRVALTFAAGAGSAYRAAAGHAPVIVEIAAVGAGRVVGRAPSLARAQRPLAAWALTGAVAAASLVWSAREAPLLPDRNEVSPARAAEIARLVQIIEDRKPPDEDEPPLPRHYLRAWRYDMLVPDSTWMFPDGPHGPTGVDAFPEFATLYCKRFETTPWSTAPYPIDVGRAFCASRVSTPFGVRGEWPPAPDLLGRDPRDLWLLRYPNRPEAGHGTVRFEAPVVKGRMPPEIVGRVMRANMASVRRCYRERLIDNPRLSGRVKVRFVIGVDGAVSAIGNGGSDLADGDVIACIVSSFRHLSFPRSTGWITTVIQSIDLSP